MMTAEIESYGTPGSEISSGDLARAAQVLASLLGSSDPLGREEAAQCLEILSRIPGGQFDELSPDPDRFLKEWNELGEVLAGVPETISLVESVYKEWTIDKGHPLAGHKGLVWGDPAAHMTEVLEGFGMTPNPEDPLPPDHLAVLLEFLAYLIENVPWQDVAAFCK
ncbi:MAG: molecular chaperone TorD family protein, partial [Deltaproteobacteria bacterium]|nr:molecular chaperone TorD family protein [Deltaproteobacteria bacterium]